MTNEEKQKRPHETFKARFRPSSSQLKEIVERCAELLENMDEEELGQFVEVTDGNKKSGNGPDCVKTHYTV